MDRDGALRVAIGMPKRRGTHKYDNVNLTAFRVVKAATHGEVVVPPPPPNAADVALVCLGGKKGGENRMARLTPEVTTAMAKATAAKAGESKTTTAYCA